MSDIEHDWEIGRLINCTDTRTVEVNGQVYCMSNEMAGMAHILLLILDALERKK